MKFKWTQILKPNIGGNFRNHPTPRQDTIRLTTKNFIIGKELANKFRARNGKIYVTIEKDQEKNALRVVRVNKNTENSYSICMGSSKADFHTVRPTGLLDMPNGNYTEVGDFTFVLDPAL